MYTLSPKQIFNDNDALQADYQRDDWTDIKYKWVYDDKKMVWDLFNQPIVGDGRENALGRDAFIEGDDLKVRRRITVSHPLLDRPPFCVRVVVIAEVKGYIAALWVLCCYDNNLFGVNVKRWSMSSI